MTPSLQQAVDSVPAGPWAIGVSGGADSVALLRLMLQRTDIALHIVHLNHQTRSADSDGDAMFVQSLADAHRIPCTIALRAELERDASRLPANPSARYRRLRHLLFTKVVCDHHLNGVLLAHHADDQAETILQRLLRGSGWPGLCGMSTTARVGNLTICRPLLDVRSSTLRGLLNSLNQPWREDASNDSDRYQRNRLRQLLRQRGELIPALLSIGTTARRLRAWVDEQSTLLSEAFDPSQLSDQPRILARRAAAHWLSDRGVPPAEISWQVVDCLLTLASDAATPNRVTFPGNIQVRRRRGKVTASSLPAATASASLPPAASPPSVGRACPSIP